jgi:hypothetical protein
LAADAEETEARLLRGFWLSVALSPDAVPS